MREGDSQPAVRSPLDYADAATADKSVVYAADLLLILFPVAGVITMVIWIIPTIASGIRGAGVELPGITKFLFSIHEILHTAIVLGALWAIAGIVPLLVARSINRGRPTRWMVWIVSLLVLSSFLFLNLFGLFAAFVTIGTEAVGR